MKWANLQSGVTIYQKSIMFDITLQVTLEAHFINDYGLDSLDVVEIVMAFENEFGAWYNNWKFGLQIIL